MHNIFKKKSSKHGNQRLSNKSVNNSSHNNNNSHSNGSTGQSVNGQHPAVAKRTTSHSPPPSAVAMSRSSTHSPLNPSLNKSAINLTNGLLVNPNSTPSTVIPITSTSQS